VRKALYKDAIDTKSWNIVDCADEPIELRVILDDGSQSIVKAVNLNFEGKVMEQLIISGTKLSNSKGNARQKSGDNGEMFGIGRRAGGGKHGFNTTPMFALSDPESKSYDKKFTESFCVAARSFSKMVKTYFPNLSMKYKEIEKKNDIDINWQLGGHLGICASADISVNLCNAEHVDCHDGHSGISMWLEKKIGDAKNWYLLLPSTYDGNDPDKKPLAIKLFHGITVIWDGRVVRHCTAKTFLSDDNDVFGFFFNVTKY
jgi:hypothetical protein